MIDHYHNAKSTQLSNQNYYCPDFFAVKILDSRWEPEIVFTCKIRSQIPGQTFAALLLLVCKAMISPEYVFSVMFQMGLYQDIIPSFQHHLSPREARNFLHHQVQLPFWLSLPLFASASSHKQVKASRKHCQCLSMSTWNLLQEDHLVHKGWSFCLDINIGNNRDKPVPTHIVQFTVSSSSFSFKPWMNLQTIILSLVILLRSVPFFTSNTKSLFVVSDANTSVSYGCITNHHKMPRL